MRVGLALGTALALVVGLGLSQWSVDQAAAASRELVVNGTFDKGLTGWHATGSRTQKLAVVKTGGGTAPHARLTTSSTATVTLNDRTNTVASAAKGETYRVTARVRASAPKTNGQVRVREVAGSKVVTHATSFNLRSTAWTTVSLTFTTRHPKASLDLNVLAWSLRAGQRLDVDTVSMRAVPRTTTPPTTPAPTTKPTTTPRPTATPTVPPTAAPEPSPTATPSPTTTPAPTTSPKPTPSPTPTTQPTTEPKPPTGDRCAAPVPSGTVYGASMSMSGGSTAASALGSLDQAFGTVPVVRLFDPGLPASWSSQRAAVTSDRTVVVSFRPDPAEVNAGKHDAALRAFFTEAPDDQTIYWSYIHEPEPMIDQGQFTAAEYRKAWQRIAGFEREACKSNMYATLILTGWTASPSSGRSVETYYAGDSVIDVIAWDPYNGVHDPDRDYYASAESMFGSVVAASKAMGKPFAIAETGSRRVAGDDGTGRARWLTEIGTYLDKHGAVFVTYFQSTRDANWVLDDKPSRDAWARFTGR